MQNSFLSILLERLVKRALTFSLSIGLAAILLYFLFRRFDTDQILVQVQNFVQSGQLWPLAWWSLVYVCIQGLRFFVVFPSRASLPKHLGLNFCNHAGNILLPGRAGEAVRPTYIKRWWPHTPLKSIVKWTVFEKICELVSMLIFVGVGLFFFYGPWSPFWSQHWLVKDLHVVGPIVALTVVFAALWRLHSLGMFRTQKRLEMGDAGPLKNFEKAFWATALSFCTWIANALGILAVMGSTQVAFALIVSMTLAGAIPFLPAGLGAAQWAAVALSDLIQIAETEALALSSAIHIVWILIRLLLGVPLLFMVWGWPSSQEISNAMHKTENVTAE